MNLSLYLLTVLIWGTTWIALKLQLGVVAIPVSIVYRFALAGLILFAILLLTRRLQPMNRRGHQICLAQGLCLFCVNFMCFLTASQWIASGLIAVVFSTATLWNALNARVFFGQKIAANVLGGGAWACSAWGCCSGQSCPTMPPAARPCSGSALPCSARCVSRQATCCRACSRRPGSSP